MCPAHHCPCWWPQYRWLPSIFKVYFNWALDSLVTEHDSNSRWATKGTTPGSLLASGTLVLSRSLYLVLMGAEEPMLHPKWFGVWGDMTVEDYPFLTSRNLFRGQWIDRPSKGLSGREGKTVPKNFWSSKGEISTRVGEETSLESAPSGKNHGA